MKILGYIVLLGSFWFIISLILAKCYQNIFQKHPPKSMSNLFDWEKIKND
jgi:hypothetical protein